MLLKYILIEQAMLRTEARVSHMQGPREAPHFWATPLAFFPYFQTRSHSFALAFVQTCNPPDSASQVNWVIGL